MNQKKTGRCQCGKIKYSLREDKVISGHHCHCKDCQRTTGSGKATILFIARKYVDLKGQLKFFESKGTSGSYVRRGFCPNCGSPIISYVSEQPDVKFIKAGSLDDSSWLKIESNFWSDTANHWDPVDEKLPTFEKNPPL